MGHDQWQDNVQLQSAGPSDAVDETPRLSILLIEDDEIDARAFLRMAASTGSRIRCQVATTLQEAFALYDEASCDLIVADYRLNAGTMVELLSLAANTPIIVVTGAGDEETAVRLLKAGISDYVVKDIQGGYLRRMPQVIEMALRQRQLRAEAQQAHAFALALADSALAMGSTLELSDVLERVIANLGRVVPHDRARILMHENDRLIFLHGEGDLPGGAPWAACSGGVPPAASGALSQLEVPLSIEGRTIGLLNVERVTGRPFTAAEAERLRAFAAYAALALHNARLYRAAQALAKLEERQRLARDLHDSVTQTLFSAATIADATQRLWAKAPDSIGQELSDLRKLTQGALAEMRTLLYELRPDGLEAASLQQLLRQLGSSLLGRSQAQVTLELLSEQPLPLPVKTALFRIAQEALNNIAKHANARHVLIRLEAVGGQTRLTIRDDGIGFDQWQASGATLGLRIMSERANSVKIELTIQSQPGKGTGLVAAWPAEATG